MLSQAAVTQRTRWHLAALTVQVRLARLRLTLNADNPFQPCVPAGSPEGGEWTRDAAGGETHQGDDAWVILSSNLSDAELKAFWWKTDADIVWDGAGVRAMLNKARRRL